MSVICTKGGRSGDASGLSSGHPEAGVTRTARLLGMAGIAVLALLAGRAAAQTTYRWQINSGTSIAGITTNWSEACGTSPTAARVTTMTTASFGCTGSRVGDTRALANDVFLTLVRSTTYSSATAISAGTFTASLRNGTGANNISASFQLGYVSGGTFTGFGTAVVQAMTTAQTTYNINLSAQTGTVPSGAALALRVRKVQAVSDDARLYLGTNNGNSGTLVVTETVVPTNTIQLVTGTNPAGSAAICPGATNVYADQFGFTVAGAADRVTELTVSGLQATTPVASIKVSSDAGATISQAAPTGNTQAFTFTSPNLAAPVGTTSYRLYFDVKGHTALAAGDTTVTPVVSSYTSANVHSAGSDTANSFTIDNSPQANVGASSTNSPTSSSLTLSLGASAGLAQYVVWAQKGSAPTNTPVDGNQYTVQPVSSTAAWVAYVGTATNPTITGLDPSSTYYFRIFARDACFNYSTTAATASGTTSAGAGTVTIGDASDSAHSAGPGQIALVDTFTLNNSGTSFGLTSLTVTIASGAEALSTLFIYDSQGCQNSHGLGTLQGAPVNGANVVQVYGISIGTLTAYVCANTATVGTNTVVNAAVTSVSPGTVSSATDNSGTLTVLAPAITIGNGTGDANTSADAGSPGRIDVFTLQTSTGYTADIGRIRVNLITGASALTNLFVNSSSACTGTTYGAVTNPIVGNNDIPVSGIGVSATASTYYVCGTAAGMGTSTAVQGNVASVAPAGTVTDNDSSTSTLTVNAVAVTIGNGSPEAGTTSVTAGQVGAIDAFSVRTAVGSVNLTSATVNLTAGNAALQNLFVNDAASCTGWTYGTLSSAPVAGSNTITLSTPIVADTTSGTKNYYLCARAATVGANTNATGRIASVVPGTVTSNDTTSGTLTVTPPEITIGPGSAEPANSAIFPGQVGPIDAFSLRTAAGTATLGTITVSLTAGSAGLASLFVNSAATCAGTTYGTLSSGLVVGPNVVTLSSPIAATTTSATTNLYVCGTGADVSSDTTVTGNVSSAGPGTATDNDLTNATLTVRRAVRPTTTGTLSATADACNQVTLSATYTGDTDANGRVTFSRSTDGTNFTSISGCTGLPGTASPRTCVDGTTVASTSYWYRAQFADDGGVTGTNPLTASAQTGVCSPALVLGNPGAQPTGAQLTAGASWTYAGQFTLAANSGTVPVASVGVANAGAGTQARADDVQLNLTNSAGTSVYSTGRWDGTKWVFEPISDPSKGGAPIEVGTTPVAFRVYATANYGAAAASSFAMRVDPANVARSAPWMATTGTAVTGNSFTTAEPTVDEGSSLDGASPMISIVSPEKGKVVSGDFLVQVYVFSANGTAIAAKGLSTNGSAPTCATDDTTLARTSHAYTQARAAMYSKVVSGLGAGTYTLKACARNGTGTAIVSSPVTVTVRAIGRGDGHLLVRDNSSQLCTDCHDVNKIRTHSSESIATQLTGESQSGSWATTCRDCHTPHGTRNLYLLKEQIVPPSVNGYQTAKKVYFGTTVGDSNVAGATDPANSSFVNSDNTGPCQVCHTRTGTGVRRWQNTGNDDDHYSATGAEGTSPCTSCHSHSRGFAALESKGGASCRTCHGGITSDMAGSAPGAPPVVPKASRHSLVGFADPSTDSGGDWGAAANLSAIAPSSRSCVNMCHQDHVHNAPGQTAHGPNAVTDASTVTTRAVTRNTTQTDPLAPDYHVITGFPLGAAGNTVKDFDGAAANGGLCISCHRKPIDASKPAIDRTTYSQSAHNSTTTSDGTTSYDWQYRLHDDSATNPSRFDRNCTKCHASRAEGTTPLSGGKIAAVHGSNDPFLLAGASAEAGALVCYDCHASGVPDDGAQGNRSGKDVQASFGKAYSHPIATTDVEHDLVAESSATWNGGQYSGPNRHVACVDCHDPHATRAGLHAKGSNLVSQTALQGARGVTYTPPTTNFAATAASNFSTNPIAATKEYEVCFKCHSSFAFGSSPPVGASDVAQEFNPANKSFHPVVAPLNSTSPASGSSVLKTTQLYAGWAPGSVMTCSDCHGDDAATPAVSGPHGSAARFILKGPYTLWSSTISLGSLQDMGSATEPITNPMPATPIFCQNCHPIWRNGACVAAGSPHCRAADEHPLGTKCSDCHIMLPHGGKVSRLIGARGVANGTYGVCGNIPPPYCDPGSPSLPITFAKSATGNYESANCAVTGCDSHPGGAGTPESW